MAEHRVEKNNIIYIIPTDELFLKWRSDEAFIDDYGRLVNRKPHRVLKELKHYVENTPMVQQRQPMPVKTEPSLSDHLKEAVRDSIMEAGEALIDRAVDKFFYEVLPNVWNEHIVPLFHRQENASIPKAVRAKAVLEQSEANAITPVKFQSGAKMSQEEADAEKRNVLYHWLEMLNSLKKLHDAGEIDIDSTMAQLTDPAMLNRVNGFLSENPNLIETDKYIILHGLLGRELYEEAQLVPITAGEIKTIAATYGHNTM